MVNASARSVFCSSSWALAEPVAGLALGERLTERRTRPAPLAMRSSRGRTKPAAPIFPGSSWTHTIAEHPHAREMVWVQEEPGNMGAAGFVLPRLDRIAKGAGLVLRSVKRSPSASPATGSAKAHELEQKTLLALAFTIVSNN